MSEEVKDQEVELTEDERLEAMILADEAADPEKEPEADTDPEKDLQEEKPEEKPEPETDPEAETKPEDEGDPEPTAEEEAEQEREREKKPENEAWARLRHKNRELERKVEELEKNTEPESKSLDNSVDDLVKVWDTGTGDESALLAGIRKAGSNELADVYQKAVDGKYGSHGEDVIKAVTEAMQMARVREDRENESAEQRRKAMVQAMEDERKMAMSDYPDYADESSEASKHLKEFTAKAFGKLDPETGKLDGGEMSEELALYYHSHPYELHQLANMVFKSSRQNSDTSKAEVAKLTKDLETVKKRLARYEVLESPSAPSSSTDAPPESLEDLEKQILS